MNIKSVVLLILFAVFLFSAIYIFLPKERILETKSFSAYLEVSSVVGFNIGTDALYFGRTLPGGSSTRKIAVQNPLNTSVYVRLTSDGELANWITFSENEFELQANALRNVSITATAPQNAELGNYSGTVTIYIYTRE
ncbi:MAG: hypothetical protein ABIH99_05455 [Candidatus Micrarchaeota archaeon]